MTSGAGMPTLGLRLFTMSQSWRGINICCGLVGWLAVEGEPDSGPVSRSERCPATTHHGSPPRSARPSSRPRSCQNPPPSDRHTAPNGPLVLVGQPNCQFSAVVRTTRIALSQKYAVNSLCNVEASS
jgi:hypothetical protein